MPEQQSIDFSKLAPLRLAHNYLQEVAQGNGSIEDLNLMNGYLNYLLNPEKRNVKKYKIGLLFVCINPPYWPYLKQVIEGAKVLFLPGHEVEILAWSDLPNFPETKNETYGADKVFPVESQEWPYPTLMRYHMLLAEEEYLNKFDYLFYLDADMKIVNVVGDEILGNGITAAQHPMYALRQNFWYPYEPNPDSSAHIKQTGNLTQKDGKPMFQPLYAAGGFQGGTTAEFIKAMRWMKKSITDDLSKNYVARWNDESHWNRYLFDNPPSIVLSPSYVYPDSMIEEYYKKLWGRDYVPRIITLTKPFTTSKEGGQAAREMIQSL